jgi:hypothetical protein
MSRLAALAELASALTDSYRKQASYALEPSGAEQIEYLEKAVVILKSYAEKQASLSCAYDPMAWRKLDGEALGIAWAETDTYWWAKRIIVRKKIIKIFRVGGAIGRPDPKKDAVILKELLQDGLELDRLDKQLSGFRDWKGHTTDPAIPKAHAELGARIRLAVSKLAGDASNIIELRERVLALLHDGNDLLAPEAAVGLTAISYLCAWDEYQLSCTTFETISGGTVRELFAQSGHALSSVRAMAESISVRHRELKDWCAWRKRRTQAVDMNLLSLVEAIEHGVISSDEIRDTFEAAYCTWWSGAVIGEDDVLRTFSTPEHTDTIRKFKELDSRFQRLTASYIAAELSGNLPEQDGVRKSSQWGILRHEIQKQKRHKPVRQLVTEIPEVLMTLAPCLMMSPLSVSQYLPADQQLFDVVIFDEASQITVWDAVGAMARGKQVIVAGDPRQMPPTNFFTRTEDDPDGDIEQDYDLESILDEMLGASIPRRTLNLHYRSRKESLIAFSNAKYYENELVPFPAPVTPPDGGVSLVRTTGFYARGIAQHNEGEAHAIVREVVRRLMHPDAEIKNKSLGIVTFNSKQQTLIENLLDAARSKNPEIEWAFSREHVFEPVFVKNLETVQGDERDVILFSVTYGPDQSGHITMNFGPLNRDGGERRLNVALTRARSEMMVFTTMHPDQIDLSRTQAKAVADLKHFLEYAERGPASIGAFVERAQGDFESPFEVAVARALKEKGWTLHPQIGTSAYRIDLGIVHPDAPGIYLAGVECDGAMYHSSAYARERDKIRQSVLEGLGWTLFRVWSTDWWTNKIKATEILDESLRNHLVTSRAAREKNSANC